MTISGLRVVYAGTPDFSVPALQMLAQMTRVVAVYTQPDRPAGRGRRPTASPVKQVAETLDLPIEQPETLKSASVQQTLAGYSPDVIVVAAYGLLLPQSVLDLPRYGCLNIHASLLPRWRGAAPIQRAIETGDSTSGVSIMQMAAGLDTGDVWLMRECQILPETTGGSLHDELASLGASALQEVLPTIVQGESSPVPQDESLATYAHKLSKREASINWSESAVAIDRKIRAFNPWPVAQFTLDGQMLRVWGAAVAADRSDRPAGEVLAASEQGIDVATGDGVLRLLQLQAPGRKPVHVRDFLNSRALAVGTQCG
jgi:methionyl-tRNA formyltransferase